MNRQPPNEAVEHPGNFGVAPGVLALLAKPDEEDDSKERRRRKILGWFCCCLLILGIGALLTLFGLEIIFVREVESESTNTPTLRPVPTSSPAVTPSRFPTSATTPRPTLSPSKFPTGAPTGIATEYPSFSPTFSPTQSPIGLCVNEDATCGCLVPSERVDVIFLVDESGSVGSENFLKIKDAVGNFVENAIPAMEPINGMRIGYAEFDTQVNEVYSLGDSNDTESFLDFLDTTVLTGALTNHQAAFNAALAMLDEDGVRANSSISVVMMTDGGSTAGGGSAIPLRRLATDYDITFFFLPINPGPEYAPINFNAFDAAIGPDYLIEGETFQMFPVDNFDLLNDVLNGDEFTIPLGPCVEPPTVSGRSYSLMENDIIGEEDFQLLI